MSALIDRFATRLARHQADHPGRYLIGALVVSVLLGLYASGIKFDSSYEALLPKNAKELANVDAVRAKTGGTRQIIVAVGGVPIKQRIRFADKVVPKLEQIDGIRTVEFRMPVDFFKDRAFWLAPPKQLKKLIPALKEAVQKAKAQANPLALHLDEEAEQAELERAWKRVEKIATEGRGQLPDTDLLHSKDGRYTFITLVPSIKFTDIARTKRLMTDIRGVLASRAPDFPKLTTRLAGSPEILEEQHILMRQDMTRASLIAIVFGILIIAGFTRRLLAPVLVATSLLAGIIWTFAAAHLYVGHVNIITGFLVAVLIGLGIDFGIHLFVRYQQERQTTSPDATQWLVRCVVGTAAPSVTAALTTAGVFFSFTLAKFRGFSEFGLIAGTGVFLTLASSFLILPPMLHLTYGRRRPKQTKQADAPRTTGQSTLPVPFALTTLIILILFAAIGAVGVTRIQFKNDFRKLRGASAATEFTDYVNKNLGTGFNPAVFLTRTPADAKTVKTILLDVKRHASKGAPLKIGKVISPADLLPRPAKTQQPLIDQIRDIVWDKALNTAARKETKQGKKLARVRQMALAKPWTIDELPPVFKRRFTTVTKHPEQFLVYAWSNIPHDADFLAAAWENTLKNAKLKMEKAGLEVEFGDETLILAWVYRLVRADSAPLLAIAALVVLLFIIIDFRKPGDIFLITTALFGGMLAFIGVAYLLGMEINMFNMIVIPSVIGIGVDNAVHILHRYHHEGPGTIRTVLRKTGSASLLASVTTAVGFGASVVAHNNGLVSMGTMAMVGISATFFSAVIALPSILTLLERRNFKRD